MSEDRTALAKDAVIWGLPLVIMGRYLELAGRSGAPMNQLFTTTVLAIPKYRQIGPNVDTLMGHALIDVSVEPQVIGVPDAGDRYYSIQLQDMYMHSFDYIGRRTTGTKPGAFAITPPGFGGTLPEGVTEIKAPTRVVLAYIRTMVLGADDLDAARAIHAGYTLGPLSAYPAGRTGPIPRSDRATLFPHVDFSKPDAGYVDELDSLVRTYPPLPWDAPNLARFAPLGIGAATPVDRDAAMQADLAEAVPVGYAEVRRSLRLTWANGWARRENVSAFIKDPLQRAANNFFGKGTHLSADAVYWGTRQGGMGDWLSGTNRYRLRFLAGEHPPVDAFWSLTLYDKDYVLFDNPIDRYAILDRTEGLQLQPDGSLEILIQAEEPAAGSSNWLPAPRGEFQLTFRAYQPREAILDGSYVPPPAEIIGLA
jgi:hypothetical protein